MSAVVAVWRLVIFVKFRNRVLLVAEHLYHLLPGYDFLDITVDLAEIGLLRNEIFTAAFHQAARREEHNRCHREGKQGEHPALTQHQEEDTGQGNHT